MDKLLQKIKYINEQTDAVYTDIINNEAECSAARLELKNEGSARPLIILAELLAALAFVLSVVYAVTGGVNKAGELLFFCTLPLGAVIVILDCDIKKYYSLKKTLSDAEKRKEYLQNTLNAYKECRAAAQEGLNADIDDIAAYTPIAPVENKKKSTLASAAAPWILVFWCPFAIMYILFHGGEGLSLIRERLSLLEAADEAGIAPYDTQGENGAAAIAVPGAYSEDALEGKAKHMEYKWSYHFANWTQSLEIPKKTYEYYRSRSRYINGDDYSVYVKDDVDDEFIKNLADSMCEKGEEAGYNEFEQIELMVSFVQNMEYIPDTDKNGKPTEYPKYPIETLYDGGGDCEDTCILLVSLIRAKGYGAAFIKLPEHMAVGIKGTGEKGMGAYYEYNGDKYYYIETTNPNWAIGQVPDENKGQSAEVIVIN